MAWIESHQELRDHPKVARMGRLLDVPRTSVIGTLHLLWWWALDHAEDGDVTDYDALDLALACDWEGDPEALVKALLECGPGSKDGFLVETGGRMVLHDWWQYAGKLVARRRIDRERKQKERGSPPDLHVQRTSNGQAQEVAGSPCGTEQNRTQPDPSPPPAPPAATTIRPDVDRLCTLLADLIEGNDCRRPTITNTWRTEARLLLDKDRVPLGAAEETMRWALADPFWKSNVLSMPTFRKQYDRLRLRATTPQTTSQRVTPHQRSQQALANVARAIGAGQ